MIFAKSSIRSRSALASFVFTGLPGRAGRLIPRGIGEDQFMDREWLAEWRVSVTAEVDQLLETFQSRFGFEPGMTS